MSTLAQAERISSSLRGWLLNDALPLWWTHGADHKAGGFHERLHLNATPTGEARRSRLHPRQVYAFTVGNELGWTHHATAAVRHALRFYLANYRRGDGLFLTAVTADGRPCDTSVLLYDQAFALLGLAASYSLLRDESLSRHAVQVLDAIQSQFRHDDWGFKETPAGDTPLLSNSHMHLFEAALEWMEIDPHPRWRKLAQQLATLAGSRFIDINSGFVLEFFDSQWQPLPPAAGQRVEPGHQFEWAWLLSRWSTLSDEPDALKHALVLIERTESHGVDRHRGVAINALAPDGSTLDLKARLWPQTERLKAALLAAQLTNSQRYWSIALESAHTLARYLETPRAGLWRDTLTADGRFIEEPAPASSLYHIAAAIAQLNRSVRRAQPNSSPQVEQR